MKKAFYRRWEDEIYEVEITKETDKTVTFIFNGRPRRMYRDKNVFDTLDEAKAYAIDAVQKKVDQAKRQVEYYEKDLAEIKAKLA